MTFSALRLLPDGFDLFGRVSTIYWQGLGARGRIRSSLCLPI